TLSHHNRSNASRTTARIALRLRNFYRLQAILARVEDRVRLGRRGDRSRMTTHALRVRQIHGPAASLTTIRRVARDDRGPRPAGRTFRDRGIRDRSAAIRTAILGDVVVLRDQDLLRFLEADEAMFVVQLIDDFACGLSGDDF